MSSKNTESDIFRKTIGMTCTRNIQIKGVSRISIVLPTKNLHEKYNFQW